MKEFWNSTGISYLIVQYTHTHIYIYIYIYNIVILIIVVLHTAWIHTQVGHSSTKNNFSR